MLFCVRAASLCILAAGAELASLDWEPGKQTGSAGDGDASHQTAEAGIEQSKGAAPRADIWVALRRWTVKAAGFYQAILDGLCGHGKGSYPCGVEEGLLASAGYNIRFPLV